MQGWGCDPLSYSASWPVYILFRHACRYYNVTTDIAVSGWAVAPLSQEIKRTQCYLKHLFLYINVSIHAV